jgi:putative ABC transport system ATP-binding protein
VSLVQLTEVSRLYDAGGAPVAALDKINFQLDEGEMVAVMGASGSGKSTLLNVIGTLDRPSLGHYQLDGVPVEGLDEPALAKLRNEKLGFVFQSFQLLPRYTAVENVELPMIYRRVPPAERRALAEEALERVGLGERSRHLPTELSGGQQQRVAIARALVNRPRLLLCDEPTGALDSQTTRQVMALFESLHRGGMTILIVTHDPQIGAYAPRQVTFRDGTIVADERRS